MMKVVITYGTFDLLHYGHFEHLKKSKELGDFLIVGVSTDEFNKIKGKRAVYPYEKRAEMIGAIKYVDLVIPEKSWEQKIEDIKKYNVSILTMGDDWKGHEHFKELEKYCQVVYTKGAADSNRISSTKLRKGLGL